MAYEAMGDEAAKEPNCDRNDVPSLDVLRFRSVPEFGIFIDILGRWDDKVVVAGFAGLSCPSTIDCSRTAATMSLVVTLKAQLISRMTCEGKCRKERSGKA